MTSGALLPAEGLSSMLVAGVRGGSFLFAGIVGVAIAASGTEEDEGVIVYVRGTKLCCAMY